jgi:hypothetical protein
MHSTRPPSWITSVGTSPGIKLTHYSRSRRVDPDGERRYIARIMAIETSELKDRIGSMRERLEAFGRYL